MIKSPDKMNLWEKGLVLTQFQDTVYSGREVAEAGAGSRGSHCIWTQQQRVLRGLPRCSSTAVIKPQAKATSGVKGLFYL